MNATIEGSNLVITLPLQSPRPSASGKNLVVASTGGNVTINSATVQGKPLTIGVNAYINP